MGTALDIDELCQRYELSYHVPYALHAESEVGLRGKRVLEVGGSLPSEFVLDVLGASQWVCIQATEWFRETRRENQFSTDEQILEIEAVEASSQLGRYSVLLGSVETLPPCLYGQFDVVFSIATFEHILRLGRALEAMAAALTSEGRLFTMFSPVWTSFNGHHIPDVVDKSGQLFGFGTNCPIPPWAHLYWRPDQMYHHLLGIMDPDAAAEITYYVYHSPQINRLFIEDYLGYVQKSPLDGSIVGTFPVEPPPDVQAHLEMLYPGRKNFTNTGMKMVLSHKSATL